MPDAPTSRRDFIKLAGLAGVGGVAGCKQRETIYPALAPDARETRGRPLLFSTVCRECPAGCGLMVRVDSGRPNKCEGNPDHPVNRGGLCLRGQSALQGLYNPDRYTGPWLRDAHGALRPTDWATALARWRAELERVGRENRGGDAVWLGRLETGSFAALLEEWRLRFGFPPPLFYEHFSYDALRAAQQAAGQGFVVPRFHIDRARYLVNFGADFLETWISNVEFAGDFAAMHSLGHTPTPARTVFIGPRVNLTAANADETWLVTPGTEPLLAWLLLDLLRARGVAPPALPAGWRAPALDLDTVAAQCGLAPAVIGLCADRLVAHRPSLVLGPGYANQHPGAFATEVACHLLNQALGNVGVTVEPAAPHALSNLCTQAELLALFDRAGRGGVRLLHLHHVNPVYDHPAIAAAMAAVPFKVSFSPWRDESTRFADLILPDLHFLESWGEYSPWPHVNGLLQPVRVPLYANRPTGDLLLASLGRAATFADYLRGRYPGPEFDAALRLGLAPAAGAPAPPPRAAPPPVPPAPVAAAAYAGEGELAAVVFPTVQLFDGRQANRGWAQEIAEPLSKIAWDGWLELNPATAARLGFQPNDVLRVASPFGAAEFPLYVTTWIRPDCAGLVLGQGHTDFGMFANGRIGMTHLLQAPRPQTALWSPQGVRVVLARTHKRREVVNLQQVRLQADKKLALAVEIAAAGSPAAREPYADESFYEFHPHPEHRWGMAIDLASCIGCNACQAACYAENNVPVVGRVNCASHREMTWIRVEIWEGDGRHPSTALDPDLRFLPMPCMQCGNAPCEYVCPVFASYHTPEGLNAQVYNRCIGTRYCSNNCIYKVRRFNWWSPQWPAPLDQQLNPQVTVRGKGVMEKCTFCVQRIANAEQDARAAQRPLRDGEIQTACMQTCPTRAITFGDLKDPNSAVSRLARLPRAYGLFADQNTYPAVRYLKRARFELNRRAGAVPPLGGA